MAPGKKGKPASMKTAEKTLGKPDIRLSGSTAWKKGFNSGAIGVFVDNDGKKRIVPQGQFVPVSDINTFKPDPELGK